MKTLIPGRQVLVCSQEAEQIFDRVIWTIPTHRIPKIILNKDVASKALSIKHIAVTCVVLIMNRKLSDIYWLNNLENALSFGVVVEHTNLVPPAEEENTFFT